MPDLTPADITQPLDHVAGLFSIYDDLAIRKAEIAEQERKLVDQIKKEMGEAATLGTVDGKIRVTWREHTRRGVDTKALKADYPEIAEKCSKVSTVRTFKVVDK